MTLEIVYRANAKKIIFERKKYSASYLGERKKNDFLLEKMLYIEKKCFTNAFRDEHLTHTTTIKSFVK